MITCTNLKLRYKGSQKNALNGISTHIPAGKTTAIVGHNGAGKSTLIKAIVGLIEPEGNIQYGFDAKNIANEIRVQMQHSHFEKGMKVKDIIQLYLGLNQAKDSMDSLLQQFDLSNYKNSLIDRLSGGERQRLAILLATVGNAKIIIFDEITTGLDSVARRQVWDLLQKIQQERKLTIILTSHFLEEVEYLADEVIIMKEGQILAQGTVDGLIESVFENTKEIHCLYNEHLNWQVIPKNHRIEGQTLYVTYEKSQEYEIYTALVQAGAYKIEVQAHTFEDVFLKIAGYHLSPEGENK